MTSMPPGGGRLLRIDGAALHVLCEGSGPVCVLASGLGGVWFDWDHVVRRLVAHRTVVRFDRPGYGLSAPAPPGRDVPSAAGEAERIRRILDALGLTGPCTVAGHSLAAFHVEAFARLYPERTAGLVLLDGSTEPEPRPRPLPAVRTAAARTTARLMTAAALPYLAGPTGRRLVVRACTVRRRDPAPDALVRRCYRPGRALAAVLLENTHYLDVAAQLAALRTRAPLPDVPVTVLAAYDRSGSRRALDWLRRQERLAEQLGGTLRIAAPARHLLMLDRPEAVAAAVLDGG
ncbi:MULTISPECIES: alpha/beta fold hydrolase [unclassified Kitasatospora]|uniref:alpha/beta fold hydrolase n=1 Tax=unclassified Kitasatospora TaxID=2633591 RepID=UPI0024745179|nr:alpha/beta hydrolase [Kitasatospora sp. MAP12-44]